jgi:O-antigen/teichoic acid export membrane protein
VTPVSTETTTAPAQSRQHVVIQRVRRLGWGVADQGISSLSNFALGLFVARSFGASNFGAFTLAFITYTVVINASRGLATDPLLVRYSGKVTRRWRSATAAATGTALVVGVAAGVICILAGLLLPDPIGPVFIALGIGLPGLALQDSWRFAFFACGRGSAAFLNDLFWSVLLIGTLPRPFRGSEWLRDNAEFLFGTSLRTSAPAPHPCCVHSSSAQ